MLYGPLSTTRWPRSFCTRTTDEKKRFSCIARKNIPSVTAMTASATARSPGGTEVRCHRPGIERSHDEMRERGGPDEMERDAIRAGGGRMKALLQRDLHQ